jgi:hypothetical protein
MTYEQAEQIIHLLHDVKWVLWFINGAVILIAIRAFQKRQ